MMNIINVSLLTFASGRLNKGTSHWLTQRASSLILIPLTILFLTTFGQNFGSSYEDNIAFYKSPYRAFYTFLFFCFTLLHFKQGAQVVIEDYVQNRRVFKVLIITNKIFFWSMTIVFLFALSTIVIENNWS